jgi:preprotein translocase subunit SecD
MKKIVYLTAALLFAKFSTAQEKLQDGVYLVDKSRAHYGSYNSKAGNTFVQFNTAFTEEEGEEYSPVLVLTDNFVPFELSMAPIAQAKIKGISTLLLKLTDEAAEKLRLFTTQNINRHFVIVVNGQALTMHKIKQPVASGLIKITSNKEDVYNQIYKHLKNNVKG